MFNALIFNYNDFDNIRNNVIDQYCLVIRAVVLINR